MEQTHCLQPLPLRHMLHYVNVFPCTGEPRTGHGTPEAVSQVPTRREESFLQPAGYIPANNPACSWPSLLTLGQLFLSTRTPMSFLAKVFSRQLIPACTVAWCYPGPDAGLGIIAFVGLHKLPVRSSFRPVPLSSSPVLQRIKHSPSLVLFTHVLNMLAHHPGSSFDALYQSLRDTTGN